MYICIRENNICTSHTKWHIRYNYYNVCSTRNISSHLGVVTKPIAKRVNVYFLFCFCFSYSLATGLFFQRLVQANSNKYTITLVARGLCAGTLESPHTWSVMQKPLNTWRNNDVVITSKQRHFDVITSKWRRFDVITTSLLRNVFAGKRFRTLSSSCYGIYDFILHTVNAIDSSPRVSATNDIVSSVLDCALTELTTPSPKTCRTVTFIGGHTPAPV